MIVVSDYTLDDYRIDEPLSADDFPQTAASTPCSRCVYGGNFDCFLGEDRDGYSPCTIFEDADDEELGHTTWTHDA